MIRRRPGRSEDGYFRNFPVRGKHLEGVAELLQRGVGNLEVADLRPVLEHLEDGGQHLGVVGPGLAGNLETFQERVELSVSLFRLELVLPFVRHENSIHYASVCLTILPSTK